MPKRVTADGYVDARPAEDIESDGCPGGWSRCGYARSFAKYIRPILAGGGHDTNPIVSGSLPAHVLDSIRFFEGYQMRAHNEFTRRARG